MTAAPLRNPMVLIRVLTLFALACVACSRPRTAAGPPPCPNAWTPQYNVDSSLGVCAPPGFTLGWNASQHAQWARMNPETGAISSLNIDLLPSAADTLDGRWPRPLAAPPTCGSSCWTVDTVVRLQDSLAGGAVVVEQGLVSGGRAHFVRQPIFVASWEPQPGWRADARGIASSVAALDTLRQMLRTATVRTSQR